MPRLTNLQDEGFCVLHVIAGWGKTDSYEATGRKRDRSNAAAFAEKPEIARRLRELEDEKTRLQGMTAREGLAHIAALGVQSGDLAPAVSAFKALGESDGSLSPQRQSPEAMSISDMLREAAAVSFLMWVSTAQALGLLDEDGRPVEPWIGLNGKPVGPYLNNNLDLVE